MMTPMKHKLLLTCLRLLLKTVLVGSPQISLRAGVTKYDLHFTS